MALWSNTDASGSTPKGMSTGFAATGTYANGVQLWANAQASIYTTNQAVGIFGVDTTEQTLSATNNGVSGHPEHAGWVLRKAGMGPVTSITANTGSYGANSSVTFSGGTSNTAVATATVAVAANGLILSVTLNSGGLYTNTPNTAPTSGNAVFTLTMGGRANRVMTETLVAMGSLTSDGTDDSIYPDS
jgi:hypothetical protein